ncbi:hypothetical protein BDR26DRAFT_867353 [Obelidium mucronatum]|nr:hypothetical protein BDR26DRAFT_867353 [Obelidium mucronatum]
MIDSLTPIFYASVAMFCFSLGEMVYLLYFITVREILDQGKRLTIKEVITPFSGLLILMTVCHLGVYGCEAALCVFDEPTIYNGIKTTQNFFLTAAEVAYIFYSYLRAEPILDQVFPKLDKPVSILVKLSPTVFGSQWLLYALAGIPFIDPQIPKTLILSSKYLSIFNGVVFLAFDVLCLVTFLFYIRSTTVDEAAATDEHFLIISRHGVASVIACIIALVFYVLNVVANVNKFFVFIFLTLLYLILFRMKVMLRRDKIRKSQRRASRIEYAAVVSVGGGAGTAGGARRASSPTQDSSSKHQSLSVRAK